MENTVLYVITGPGDKTHRPRRKGVPYTPPEDVPPVSQPSEDKAGDAPAA